MRKVLITLVVLLVLLAVGAVVADRVVHARTEARLEDELSGQVDVDGGPDLTVHGFPFLTQLLDEELQHVTVRASGLRVEGLDLRDVHAEAYGVGIAEPHPATDVTATATVPLATVEERVRDAGLDVDIEASADDGFLRLTTELLGTELGLSARPEAVAGELRLSVEEVTLAGRTASLADLGLEDVDSVPVPLEGLPDSLDVQAVTVVDDGVRVELTGQEVPLAELAELG
ncbi:DUF2993 domain-containing protein [Georgenia sp. 10Sc9-8]|uniref:DUF2993 domain-containing protein n=1 Tax=Georgenia halotolerans TaxID=3028317 RepID=A0ABT5TVQ1_9MICO|nr:DUF2993 domain-containing protein [Georgenia halotolerans]